MILVHSLPLNYHTSVGELNVHVKDIIFLVILDTCRNCLGGKQIVNQIADSYSEALDPKIRPAVSVLCMATSRSKEAWENPEVCENLSAFTHYLTSEECGLFEPNVPVKMAIEIACQKLRQHPKAQKQDPTPVGLDRIPADFCLNPHLSDLPAIRYDVCMCYHDTDVDVAYFVHDKLQAANNSLTIFFSAVHLKAGLKDEQISGAILHSRLVILIVTEKTFQDIPGAIDALGDFCESPLAYLLMQCELIVERCGLFDHEKGGAVVPIYCGVERDGVFEKLKQETLWPSCTNFKHTVKSISARVRRLLRSDGLHMAKLMSDRNLPYIKSREVASLVKGRDMAETFLVLKKLRNYGLVGMKQSQGDHVSRLICENLTSCIHRHDQESNVVFLSNSSMTTREKTSEGQQDVLRKRGAGSQQHDDKKMSSGLKRQKPLSGAASQMPHGEHTRQIKLEDNGEVQSNSFGKRVQLGSAGDSSGSNTKRPKSESVPCDSGMSPHLAGGESSSCDTKFDSKQAGAIGGRSASGGAFTESSTSKGISRVMMSVRDVFPYDVLISHTWDKDDEGRDNHERTRRLNSSLQSLGFTTCFVEEPMEGNCLTRMAKGIEGSAVILICVTRRYMEKVADDADNSCKFEFDYALNKRTTLNMLPIVMEDSVADTSLWHGILGMTLGRNLYRKLTGDANIEFENAVKDIAVVIREKIQPQTLLSNELQEAARQMSSRSQSPAPSAASGLETLPASPLPSSSQDIFALYIKSEVGQFKDDMKKIIQGFNPAIDASDQPARKRWRMCELMLVAFMRNIVAPSCDSEEMTEVETCEKIAENLQAWRDMCVDPERNLIDGFNEWVLELKPPIFKDLEYEISESSRQNHVSVFAIDWMVQKADSKDIPSFTKKEWVGKIVQKWFDSDEEADTFLDRAETFFLKGAIRQGWKILAKVIQTNSYVVFFRMETLTAMLVREHWALEKRRNARSLEQADCLEKSNYVPPLAISLLVSSSKWHLSLADGEAPNETQISEIVWRLKRIASLPRQILEAAQCCMSKVEFVEWEQLYTLVHSKKGGRYLAGCGGSGDEESDDDDFDSGGGEGGSGAAISGGAAGEIAVLNTTVQQLFIDRASAIQNYLIDLDNKVGSYHDAASGEKMRVGEESISLKAVASESGEIRCERDPKAEDLICPINHTMMKDPVKCFEGSESRTFTISSKSYERSAIERVFDDAQKEGRQATSPWTRELLKTQFVDGKLCLVLQPDEDMHKKIEALQQENRKREAREMHEAEGEEERKIARRRMGYAPEDIKAEDAGMIVTIESAEELLGKLRKGDYMCVIGPPASGKTLTMFQVSKTNESNMIWNIVIKCRARQSVAAFLNSEKFSALFMLCVCGSISMYLCKKVEADAYRFVCFRSLLQPLVLCFCIKRRIISPRCHVSPCSFGQPSYRQLFLGMDTTLSESKRWSSLLICLYPILMRTTLPACWLDS